MRGDEAVPLVIEITQSRDGHRLVHGERAPEAEVHWTGVDPYGGRLKVPK
jgi:hypothetical protein